ncbi:sodium pump decarboxylase subunit gamma [Fervidicella metallireducens AeB]|uniref:Sodium pump decarboxylase subunit gamma n=1 Tax=Fervidicella metallireducens AeB TaxID=1403537 RepID=A0A017RTE8_9CLOT|nr:OadG family protein [Fervidicella metallireducens]EYE87937.1 sodium pump decarboxylase subunit gamma [Fervidicella metallireducens AeB]
MSLAEKLSLGLNTTVVCMLIVFIVLILLSFIIVIQNKILNFLTSLKSKKPEDTKIEEEVKPQLERNTVAMPSVVDKSGIVRGDAKLCGIADEETAAVIMAAVSEASDIPLSKLNIKSIRLLDEKTSGEMKISGLKDSEVAVVVAAVKEASGIPLTNLKIKSIKRLDDNWSNTAKQDQINKRM